MLTVLKWLLAVAVVTGLAIVVARFLFPLPDRAAIKPGQAIAVSPDTGWGRFLTAAAEKHPGKSGVFPLASGHGALASRLLLAREAERSIDVMYYIWHNDVSGRLLLETLSDAAKRGVRVRLLVDDNGIHGMDEIFSSLNATENFEVRLFNPSTVRSPKLAGYAFDFFRMNRRMHNKAFIVDGAAAILGGRNIGDEYFSIGDQNYFLDLDVMAAGAIVPETAADFDRYWNSESVYPIEMIVGPPTGAMPSLALSEAEKATLPEWFGRLPEIEAQIEARIASGEDGFEWTDVKLVSDDPAKGLGKATDDQLMIAKLANIARPINTSLDLISAYFIPGKQGVEFFSGVARSGAKVAILTNSLQATDVALVHAGYSKYRRDLLEAGVELYELKPQPGVPSGSDELSLIGSSGSSLHAKTLSVDQERIFIGSFNFDPRSVALNCEMGFLIESPAMARQMRAAFTQQVAQGSYKVELRDNEMRWVETGADGAEVAVHNDEPNASITSRLMVTMLGWLPIEWML
ncbi:MAG: phospholipase D family protein [Proteobacteria bacterium]|nr:phospholipase D family protein [Pseudomonadota bacterium]